MGIYVHIPFCRSKCYYCGFYSVSSFQFKDVYIQALMREIELRKEYLPQKEVSTLYFGGGTPSILSESELGMIVSTIHKTWNLSSLQEASIEMNPEDVCPEKLVALRKLGFNRLTIGVQSFNDAVLKRINRTHDSRKALQAIENAVKSGFDNIGIDLIIGLPGSTMRDLEYELETVSSLGIDHISVYILSVDSNSVFDKLSEKGKFQTQDDDVLADQYLMVSEYLKRLGYEHYEISNFAKNLKYSRHNMSYWQQKPYIGLGASAHSFDLHSRQWNAANINTYIKDISKGSLYFEKEVLTGIDKFNEYMMTNFRTSWGINTGYLSRDYPEWWVKAERKIALLCQAGLMLRLGDRIRMTERGWLVSDRIFTDLFES